MALGTGGSTTAAFTTNAYVACFTEIGLGEQTGPAVNSSCLDTTGFETYLPGDLIEPGTVTIPYYVDAETAAPVLLVTDTLTITLPLGEGETAAGVWAGTGFLTGYTPGNFVNNEMNTGSLTWQWDGNTGPTYTPATIV